MEEVPESAIRAQVKRMLESRVFARADRVRKLFSYLIDQTLAGCAGTLAEKGIAEALYPGRAYDPASNAGIRLDMRALRTKTAQYYAVSPADPIVISLPQGSFVPVFNAKEPPQSVGGAPLDGVWKGRVTYQSVYMVMPGAETFAEVFEFEVDRDRLYGTATFRGRPLMIEHGGVSGDRVTFQTHSRDGSGNSLTLKYSGKLSGNEIDVQFSIDCRSYSPEPRKFTATRIVQS
jgi:hypothetical protein